MKFRSLGMSKIRMPAIRATSGDSVATPKVTDEPRAAAANAGGAQATIAEASATAHASPTR
jgi:hypothetical protein